MILGGRGSAVSPTFSLGEKHVARSCISMSAASRLRAPPPARRSPPAALVPVVSQRAIFVIGSGPARRDSPE